MKHKKLLIVGAALGIFSGAFYINSISAESPTELIQTKLSQQGVSISSISAQQEDLKVETKSVSSSGKATIDDIKAIRAVRNEVRSGVNGTNEIKNIDLAIKGANGKTIYDEVSNDVTHIPDFSKKIQGSLESTKVLEAVICELQGNGMDVKSVDITDSVIGGKLAKIVIKADVSEINSLVPKIEQWIMALNDAKDSNGISQYDLTINGKDNEVLFYLTADLVYRDFYWWQSDALGGETWTNSGPESEKAANSKDKVEATLEKGITAEPPGVDNNGLEEPQIKK
ncbi:hypothetical protein JDW19_07130 [Paenibacillus polymyxa]|uniref:Uncharacterized protein n=1 Tax=Paenibacillus polymyxa TaxID=1406 RepID=A0A8I1ITR1_PAEPO|nr:MULTISPECIES: hypothetical protein [Paenibacillus]KAF6574230.1 hypothetical protein G9G53_10510 [Paenibacillus sp. EKM206P]KAF6588701.1 hypothetical protein G9G52_11435 [Paenibacillus sp. EKM205P]MBM0632898.1 hypothetical protein [Paenibacillus polymyxa]